MIADGERCVNWYVEQMEVQGAANNQVLYPTPGVVQLVMATTGSRVRAIFAMIMSNVERCFAVISTTLYELSSVGVLTSRGAVIEDVNPSTMVTNGDGGGQLFIATGTKGYLLNLTTNVLTNPVNSVTMGGMVDGYFLALDITTSKLKISNLLDGTTWDPTQFAQRSAQPDPWRSMIVNYNEIFLFGQFTTDVWYDSGAFPFPFVPRPGGTIQRGIGAIFSAAVLEGTVIWLSNTNDGNAQIVAAQGYFPQRISTHAVEYAISRYATITDAVAWTYQDQGHPFYVLNFPSANATWVYDKNANLWHERGTWIAEQNRYDAWHPQCHAFAFGKHIVGDRNAPTIYTMDINNGLDVDSRPIRRVRRPPSLQHELQYQSIGAFEVQLEPGLGLLSGQGSDPRVSLRTSKDGGETFGSERFRSAGKIGKYGTRVIWERNGLARNFVPELVVSDPIPWRVVNAFVTVEGEA